MPFSDVNPENDHLHEIYPISFPHAKVRKQRHEEAEREVKRSEEYIQRLQQEEVRRIEEQRKEQERLQLQDEEIARKLAEVGIYSG